MIDIKRTILPSLRPPPPPPQTYQGPDEWAIEAIDEGWPPEEAPPLLCTGKDLDVHSNYRRKLIDGRPNWGEGAVLSGFSTIQTSSGQLQCALVLQTGLATLLVKIDSFEALFCDLDDFYNSDAEDEQLSRLAATAAKRGLFNTTNSIVARHDEAQLVVLGPVPFARLVDSEPTKIDVDWFAFQLQGVDVSKAVGIGRFFKNEAVSFKTILQRSPGTSDGQHLQNFQSICLQVLKPLVVATRYYEKTDMTMRKTIKEDGQEIDSGLSFVDFLVQTSPNSTEFEFASSAQHLLLKKQWQLNLTENDFHFSYTSQTIYVLFCNDGHLEFNKSRIGWREGRRLLNTHSTVIAFEKQTNTWIRAVKSGNCQATDVNLCDSAVGLLMSCPEKDSHTALKRLRQALEEPVT